MQAPERSELLALLAGAAVVVALVAASPARAVVPQREAWVLPVREGRVVSAFAFDPARPFARGARRGVALAGRSGGPVRSACSGRVTWTGPTPGAGAGRAVSVRCGALVATHLGLGSVAVRRGMRVAAGERLGLLAASGRMRLGARTASEARGYLDPMTLMGAERPPRPPVAVPSPRSRPVVPRPRRVPAPAPVPALAPAPAPAGVPVVAWAGLALVAVAAATGAGATVGRRRRRRGPVRAAAEL